MRLILKLSWALTVFSALASAQSIVSTKTFNIPTSQSEPQGITSGPDGALWFTENTGNKIGRITTGGSITEFTIPTALSKPYGITTGPDGALWFTEVSANKIGRITTSGVFSEYPVPTASAWPTNIVSGPDGALWFTEEMGNNIGRITTNGTVNEYPVPTPVSLPFGIAVGSDGALWFTEANAYQIGHVDISGLITEYQPPSVVPSGDFLPPMYAITAGPGGLWFISGQFSPNTVGRVTASGSFTNYDIPPQLFFQGPFYGITAGPDGALWFTALMGGAPGSNLAGIGRITTTGAISQYFIPPAAGFPQVITIGPDGAMWFTAGIGSIVQITLSATPPLQITTTSLPSGMALSPYSQTLTATGGTPPYTWVATSALPAGLTLSSQGVLSGTPLTATTTIQIVTVRLTDAASGTATRSFTFSVLPAPIRITTTALPGGTIFTPYSQTLTAAGGTPPYAWYVAGASPPVGLALSSAGVITGTPTMAGSSAFTVRVLDTHFLTTTQDFNIVIQAGCSTSISSNGQSFTAAGGSGSVVVTTGPSCSRSLTGVPSWVTITGGASGTGTGPISYTIAPNSAATRSATLTIDGLPYTIQQTGPALSFVGAMPHLVAEGGWNTRFTLINKASTSIETQISVTDGNGSPLALPLNFVQPLLFSATEASAQETMGPNAVAVIQASGPASNPFLEGSAQISATGNADGFAIFHFDLSNQEAVVPLETRNASSYRLAFDNTNNVLTGIAIENLSAQSAAIPLILRDDAGAQIGAGSISLNGGGHTSFVLTTQYPETANLRGIAEFDTPSGGRISVLGIRYTPPGTLTTIPALASVGTTGGAMAHLAMNSSWQTTFVLVNTGTSPASATLNFFDDNGIPLALPLTFPQGAIAPQTASSWTQNIPANASFWATSVGANPAAATFQGGSAQLKTTGNVSGFVIFRYNTNGQEAVVPLESRNASAYLLAFDNSTADTGVAVSNASAQAVTIPVTLRDEIGNILGTGSIPLSANGHTSFQLTTQFPTTVGVIGTVEFDAPSGASISVLGIRSPPALTFTTLPALVN